MRKIQFIVCLLLLTTCATGCVPDQPRVAKPQVSEAPQEGPAGDWNTQPFGSGEYNSGLPQPEETTAIKREDRELVKLSVSEAASADVAAYSTKLVEISGTVDKVMLERTAGSKSLRLVAVIEAPAASLDFSTITCVLPDDLWKKVAADSTATVRGILSKGLGNKELRECELVEATGEGALETTPAEMFATASESLSKAAATYHQQTLVVRGEFVKLTESDEEELSYYTVAMHLKGAGEKAFPVHFAPVDKQLFAHLKPGDEVTLLGIGCVDMSAGDGHAVGLASGYLLPGAK